MNIQALRARTLAMSLYRDIYAHPAIHALKQLLLAIDGDMDTFYDLWGTFFEKLMAAGGDLPAVLCDAMLFSDNAFSRNPKNALLPVKNAARLDIETMQLLAKLSPKDFLKDAPLDDQTFLPAWEQKPLPAMLAGTPEAVFTKLISFYAQNGFGPYAKYRAFSYGPDGLMPIHKPDPITLSDLKGYEAPRNAVLANTKAFISGLPANNVLLYGDRGTGKSSTVHALANAYAQDGLRIVEISKEAIGSFGTLIELLEDIPLYFIVFIDDLSFSRGDESFASLKAVLEGALRARPKNMLIYATSNRRHLVRETFSSREGDEVHRSDTIQELTSLSDRFGLMITFQTPSRDQYYAILAQMAKDRRLVYEEAMLFGRAEAFALERGGRSPRAARQFMDLYEAEMALENI